jgi:hypothetical protein
LIAVVDKPESEVVPELGVPLSIECAVSHFHKRDGAVTKDTVKAGGLTVPYQMESPDRMEEGVD